MQQIKKDINENQIKSLYLLCGEEDYLRQKYKNDLKKAVAGDDESMNYAYYEGKNADAADIITFAQTLPFFADKRMVIVENAELNKKPTDEWIAFLGEVPEYTCVVLVEKEVDKRGRFYKACKKYGYIADLDIQKESFLVGWVKEWLKEKDCNMSDANIKYFLGVVANNMGIIQNELEKLYSYSMGTQEITKELIDQLATRTIENRIFEMIEAATGAESEKAFRLYNDLLALKEAPMKILILLTRQINILLQVKDHLRLGHASSETAKAVGVPPFVVNKVSQVAKRITYKKLKCLLENAVQLEEDIKMGRIKDNIAVEVLLTECCR